MLRDGEKVVDERAKDAKDERRVAEGDHVEGCSLGKGERTFRWVALDDLASGYVSS